MLGPTASGKSGLGLALAERYRGEIINCDSTAVYRGFDIGTDKLAAEQRRGIPHHLIDIADPTEVYTAAQFARDAEQAIRDIHGRGRLPILVGGGASGQLKGDRHLSFPAHTPMSNLMLSVLDKLGVHQDSFGDSTGKLEI